MDWFLYDRDLRHERTQNKEKCRVQVFAFHVVNVVQLLCRGKMHLKS